VVAGEDFECLLVELPCMEWPEIETAVRSSDPDQVNDAIDRIEAMDREQRFRLFDAGFEDLASIYRESTDGYVRQSVVRTVDALSPGLPVAVALVEDGDTEETREPIERRFDAATGFLIEAIQDDDGRVRQSATRALEDTYRGYEALEDTDTVAALAAELGELAEEYDDKRRDHLLDSKEDAEFFLRPAGTRMIENIRRMAEDL
jgi:hypothetical protein